MEKLDPLRSKLSEHHFSEAHFEKSLSNLKNTQESIANLSTWCLQHRQHHKKIVTCWFKIMKKAKMDSRLILFYLANDVIQYSKRKNYDFVNTWALFLQRAVTLVRDDKVKTNISRIFKIWGERGIYDETFIADLNGLLDCQKGVSSDTAKLVAEFQPLRLVDKIRGCKILEDDTDLKLKHIKDYPLDLTNADTLRSSLKDRRHGADLVSEVDQGMVKIQNYVSSLKEEIKERAKLIELLEQGEVFYEHQKGEAKIVVTAYKNFGFKVKKLKKAAEEFLPSLSSPVPSPDINAPSPSGSDDLLLPDPQDAKPAPNSYDPMGGHQMFMQSGAGMPGMGGSFIGSGLSFDFQSFSEPPPNVAPLKNGMPYMVAENNPIEVIGGSGGNKKPDEGFNINEFIKCLNPINAPPPPLPPPPVKAPQKNQRNANPHLPPLPMHLAGHLSGPLLMSFTSPPPPPPPGPPNQQNFKHSADQKGWNNSYKQPNWGPNNNQKNNWGQKEHGQDMDWAGPEKKMKYDDGPVSPPMFEKEGFNQPVQYDDRTGVVPEDVDHRAARMKKDIDHRNLISLTGPSNSVPKPSNKIAEDSDLRTIPPLLSKNIDPPMGMKPKADKDFRNNSRDMNESVDMELSDEEPESARRKRNGSDAGKKPLLPTPEGKEEEPSWNPPPPGSEEEDRFKAKPHLEEYNPMMGRGAPPGHQDSPDIHFGGPGGSQCDPFGMPHGGHQGDMFGGPMDEMFGGPMGPPGGFERPPGPGGPQFRPRAAYGKYNPGYTPGFTNRAEGGPGGPPPIRGPGPPPIRGPGPPTMRGPGAPPMMRGPAPQRFRGGGPGRPFRGGRGGRANFPRW